MLGQFRICQFSFEMCRKHFGTNLTLRQHFLCFQNQSFIKHFVKHLLIMYMCTNQYKYFRPWFSCCIHFNLTDFSQHSSQHNSTCLNKCQTDVETAFRGQSLACTKSKYKMVVVLPIRIVQSNVSSIGPSSERNDFVEFSQLFPPLYVIVHYFQYFGTPYPLLNLIKITMLTSNLFQHLTI